MNSAPGGNFDRQSAVSGAGTVEGSAPSVEDFIELFFSNSDPQFTSMTEATIGDTVRIVLRMTTNGTDTANNLLNQHMSIRALPLKILTKRPTAAAGKKSKKIRQSFIPASAMQPLALQIISKSSVHSTYSFSCMTVMLTFICACLPLLLPLGSSISLFC